MGLFGKKKEAIIALDIGSNSIKLLEIDGSNVISLAKMATPSDLFSSNSLNKPDKLAEIIGSIFESSGLESKRIAFALPSPASFIKKIQVQKMQIKELDENIRFEASNYIPHSIDAVRLDYHILGEANKSQLDVLLVAVKNEIIDPYLEALNLAGFEPAVADVDYFALQNAFEFLYPDSISKTVALVNIGARFTSINICRAGGSLFTGDVSVGGKNLTDAIMQATGLNFKESENLKIKRDSSSAHFEKFQEILDQHTEYLAGELHRQLSFFWNATGEESGIDQIMLSGGASQLPGLVDELSSRTGIECLYSDPFKFLNCADSIDKDLIKESAAVIQIALGLSLRVPADRILPDFD